MDHPFRIAVASAHLGGVNRGVETWARDLAAGLVERAVGVTLFKGNGQRERPYEKVLRSLAVSSRGNEVAGRLLPDWSWRLGLGNSYAIAERTFGLSLLAALGPRFDLVHTQDKAVAGLTNRARRLGMIRAATVYAHGTGASFEFLKHLQYVQLLTPSHMAEARRLGVSRPSWTVIPNFVDPARFVTVDKPTARAAWGLPNEAQIVLTVGAVDHPMKRLDFLVRSFARFLHQHPDSLAQLVIAGHIDGAESQSPVVRLGKDLLGSRVHFLLNVPHDRMPILYPSADLFVLCSLNEPFGLVLLEAAACGTPCLAADTPSLRWILGADGVFVGMQDEDELADVLASTLSSGLQLKRRAETLRAHCIRTFGRDVVLGQIVDYYGEVMRSSRHTARH